MIHNAFEVAQSPRFYHSSSEKNAAGRETSPFAAQLLATRPLLASASERQQPGGAILLENRMLQIMTEIARHIQNNTTVSGIARYPDSERYLHSISPTLPGCDSAVPSETLLRQFKENAPVHSLGTLSARFESGNRGIEAIGYDRQGGTSYGKYQISSRAGSMERFIHFLEGKAPDWAQRLQSAGPADTGSRAGAMPEVWKEMAAEDPVKFGNLQHAFIRREYYMPARDMILDQTGLNFDEAPSALQEVLWSTAVQHGPGGAARIFGQAADKFLAAEDFSRKPQDLIEEIFDIRSRQFSSSTEQVQSAVRNRFNEEKQLAFSLLKEANSGWHG